MTLLFIFMLRLFHNSADCRASVAVSTGRSQHWEYEKVSVICEPFDSGEWMVWRYTTDSLEAVLSRCGSGWGRQTSSTCEIKTLKLTDSGVYWCESKHRDSSNGVNIDVTGASVILHGPNVPVMEGHDVTLHCEAKKPSSSTLTASFFKDGSFINTEPAGHMTIHNFSKSDEGAYRCDIGEHGASPASWLLMDDDPDPARLSLWPSSSQLFEYENLSLSCGDNSSLHGWRVIRAVSTTASQNHWSLESCGSKWGIPSHFGCNLYTAKPTDSGVYWCERSAKQRSNSADITVYETSVILRSPVPPVVEGDNVTLQCKTKSSAPSLPAAFYKDGYHIRTEPTGHMTIHHVSWSDEGIYKCHISGHGESPPSWLFVRDPNGHAPSTADPTTYVLRVIRHLVVILPYFISTVLMVSLYPHRPTGGEPSVSMTMSPSSDDDERVSHPCSDVIDDVTTEHHF